MELNHIIFDKNEGIGWGQFNRPDKLNAVNPGTLEDLKTVMAHCKQDEEIKVVILIGMEKAFVAGADIENMSKADIKSAYDLTDLTMEAQEKIADLPKPTIAAISGFALGAGLEIALCCDFRIAAENAVLGLPEITLGIIPGGGGTQRLPRLINLSAANRLILTGEPIDSNEAKRIGLVDEVVPLNRLRDESIALASKLKEWPFLAVQAAKKAIRKTCNTSLKEGLQTEQDLFCMLFGTDDQKEGMAAFLEKRKPLFKGR